jgi:hypothetical protein
MEREVGSKVIYLENLTQLVEQQKELGVQQSHMHEAEAALAAIIETREQAVKEYRRTRLLAFTGHLQTASVDLNCQRCYCARMAGFAPYPPFAIPVGTGSVGWKADLPRSQGSGEVAQEPSVRASSIRYRASVPATAAK